MVMYLFEKIDTIDKAAQIVIYTKGSKYFLSMKKIEKAQEEMYQLVFSGTVDDFYNSEFYKKKGPKKGKGLGSGI